MITFCKKFHAMFLGLYIILTLLFAGGIKAQYVRGYLQAPQGSAECNPCVKNVVLAVNTLRNRGETMGFNWGDNYPIVTGAGSKSHWQGVQRMPILPGAGLDAPFIVVSSSHRYYRYPPGVYESLPAHFAVVEMDSRGRDNRRLRSNRLEHGKLTKDVPPHTSDRIVRAHTITTEYDHPGGMQAIGKYLLVGSDGSIGHSRKTALFTIWDMSNPFAPDLVWGFEQGPVQAANSMGIVKLADGRYLMSRARGDAEEIDFYVSKSTNIETQNNWTYRDYWHFSELKTEIDDSTWGALDCGFFGFGDAGYQNTNLIKDCDGTLYLIASHGRCPGQPFGSDFVDAYRLDVPAGIGDVVITKVAKRHMFPGDNASDRQGDLQAAGGIFISPDNRLYFYATEHGRNGPDNTVEMIEFGPQEARPNVTDIEDGWVELYEHKDFDGRSIILDYADRNLRDYNDFDGVEKFDNIASSVIYSIPVGYRLRFYEHDNEGGEYIDVIGTGSVERIADFNSVEMSNGKSANDNFSSARWNVGRLDEVWVDFNYSDDFENGSVEFPYKTLLGGLAGVSEGGVIKIKSGSSDETIKIEKKTVTLQAPNGVVVIGKK